MRIFSDSENKLTELLDGEEKKLFLDLVEVSIYYRDIGLLDNAIEQQSEPSNPQSSIEFA